MWHPRIAQEERGWVRPVTHLIRPYLWNHRNRQGAMIREMISLFEAV